MSVKAIYEQTAKSLIRNSFSPSFNLTEKSIIATPSELPTLPQLHPWLLTESLVCKPDELIKRRGKLGLVIVRSDYDGVCGWIHEKTRKPLIIGAKSGNLQRFLIEPFIQHQRSDEHYVCMFTQRDGDVILFCSEGGVDVGNVDAKAKKFQVTTQSLFDHGSGAVTPNHLLDSGLLDTITDPARKRILAEFIAELHRVFAHLHFNYLEINPLVVTSDPNTPGHLRVHILDVAAKLDQCAEYLFSATGEWSPDGIPVVFPPPFGLSYTPEERLVAELDARTGASMKLTLLNPDARIWTVSAGGGASVIFADTICQLAPNGAADLANYGEYSGAPSESQTYEYARTILSLMTRGPVNPQDSRGLQHAVDASLRLFIYSSPDRPRRGSEDFPTGFPFGTSSPSEEIHNWCPDVVNPVTLPKAKKLLSTRLAFAEKSILRKGTRLHETTQEGGQKARSRWLSGRYHSGEFNPFGSTSSDFVPDFARSAPDREMMTAAACDAGVMDELLGAVNIVVARQNQWCPASERSTLQVTRAAQSSTHLFICKSVDEKSCDLDDVYTSRSMCSFDEESAFPVFFKHSTCYDVMPKSAKLLILDSTLPIRKAIQSLTDHALDAAPVWSSRLQTYTHVLTQDICLRLLAQVFPNDKPDAQEPPPERNPGADMSYWEGKTLGSVLKTYNAWARTEDSNLQLETPCVVTPQQHLHRVVQLLTVGVPVKKRAHSTVSKETMGTPTTQNSASDCSSTNHQPPSAESEDTPMQQTIPPPRHIIIADLAGSGNLLGILTSDRLLAYLRVRMRNLPNPSLLKVPVGDLIGVRWEERSWPVGDPFTISGSRPACATSAQQSLSSAATSVPATSTGSPFYLHPSTTCLQALHIMNSAWATMGLVCLPVATETGRGFQGMLSKMDILSCVFSDTAAVSLSTPISMLLAARPRPPGCTAQAMCFVTDSLLTVIDSIFRQKVGD
ncbi:hypothetical protein AAHC03_024375 [Spirometra sp. Aus1]